MLSANLAKKVAKKSFRMLEADTKTMCKAFEKQRLTLVFGLSQLFREFRHRPFQIGLENVFVAGQSLEGQSHFRTNSVVVHLP